MGDFRQRDPRRPNPQSRPHGNAGFLQEDENGNITARKPLGIHNSLHKLAGIGQIKETPEDYRGMTPLERQWFEKQHPEIVSQWRKSSLQNLLLGYMGNDSFDAMNFRPGQSDKSRTGEWGEVQGGLQPFINPNPSSLNSQALGQSDRPTNTGGGWQGSPLPWRGGGSTAHPQDLLDQLLRHFQGSKINTPLVQLGQHNLKINNPGHSMQPSTGVRPGYTAMPWSGLIR